jgi:uncharacterized phiE125 gp8 family phage protein
MAGLITVDEYKEYAGLPADDPVHDTVLGALIEAASMVVETWCRRSFLKASVTEWCDGGGTPVLALRRAPIQLVASVALYENGGQGEATTVASTEYAIDADAGLLLYLTPGTTTSWGRAYWPRGVRNIQVVYEGGFATLPAPVGLGVKLLTSFYYQRRGGDPSVTGESGGGWSSSASEVGELPAPVAALLAPYRCMLISMVTGPRMAVTEERGGGYGIL